MDTVAGGPAWPQRPLAGGSRSRKQTSPTRAGSGLMSATPDARLLARFSRSSSAPSEVILFAHGQGRLLSRKPGQARSARARAIKHTKHSQSLCFNDRILSTAGLIEPPRKSDAKQPA